MDASEPVAVILAAGRSSRLGRPKALADCGGEALIRVQLRRLNSLGIDCIVVTRAELLADVSAAVEGCSCTVIAPDDPSNRTGNLKAGLNAAGAVEAVLVVPVDRPGWSLETVRGLLRRSLTCCPEKDGRGGHPLLIRGEDVDLLRDAADDAALNRLFTTERVEVDDPFLHLNVDATEDVLELMRLVEWMTENEG